MFDPIKSIACAIAIFAGGAVAEPFTFQGSLTDTGSPANGNYDMTFTLADSAAGGFALAVDSVNNVPVVDGVFTVEIDFPSSLMNSNTRWISINVEGTILSPRVRLRDTPRAQNAVRANSAGTIETPLDVTDSSTTVVRVGATSSTGTAIHGEHLNSAGTTPGVRGSSDSTGFNAAGVRGEITSTTPGSFSAGVRGANMGTGFTGIGVYGSHNGSGWGMYGESPSGRGVFGSSNGGTGLYGSTLDGVGVFGSHSTAGTEASIGTDDYGLEAYNTDTEAEGTAIYGEGGRVGVHGYGRPEGFGSDLTRIGVQGLAGGVSSGGNTFFGVHGFGINPASGGLRTAYGVFGSAQVGNSGNTAYGIYGDTVGPGGVQFAGFFSGNVHITGTLSKSAGTFKIDHPQDPENRYLSHSFVESPDMMNIYNGVIVLDDSGNAVVELPGYFEALNSTFRYQLTAIGAPMPNLYIASEISSNAFSIAGGVPGAKVSWEVTGVRQDPSALANAIVVEEDKPEQHRGKYLDPDAYGVGNDKAIHPSPSAQN